MVDTSTFDAAAFMNTEVSEPLDTKLPTIPAGDYKAIVGDGENDVKARPISDEQIVMDVTWKLIDCDEIAKNLGLPPELMRVRQGVFIDFENGAIATGTAKNVQLGRLREALGQNKGKAWNPGMLRGAGPCTVKVVNKPAQDGSGDIYANVVKVAPLV